jgi:hypothetical protein
MSDSDLPDEVRISRPLISGQVDSGLNYAVQRTGLQKGPMHELHGVPQGPVTVTYEEDGKSITNMLRSLTSSVHRTL